MNTTKYTLWRKENVCSRCKEYLSHMQVTMLSVCPYCGYQCLYLADTYSVRYAYEEVPFLFFFKRRVYKFKEIRKGNNSKVEIELV